MTLRPLLVAAAALCGSAAFAQEPPQALETPLPGLRFHLLNPDTRAGRTAPNFHIPRAGGRRLRALIAGRQPVLIAARPAGVCSVPLANALRGPQLTGPMPVITPPPGGLTVREAPLPAPPCGEPRP